MTTGPGAGAEPDPLREWRAKLDYLQTALAQSSDPAQKFGLDRQIAEAAGYGEAMSIVKELRRKTKISVAEDRL